MFCATHCFSQLCCSFVGLHHDYDHIDVINGSCLEVVKFQSASTNHIMEKKAVTMPYQ